MSLVHSIDVSNYQPRNLSALIKQYNVEHVVVRLSTERVLIKEHAKAQLQSALDNGCTVSGYIWAYFDLDPAEHTAEAIQVGEDYPLTHLWFDCEAPQRVSNLDAWLSTAVKTAEDDGYIAGVYVGRYWWEGNHGSHAFGRLPLWVANWDEKPNLVTPLFGGWTKISGKQWTSTNETMDRNDFDSAIFAPVVPPTSPIPPTSSKDKLKADILREIELMTLKINAIIDKY